MHDFEIVVLPLRNCQEDIIPLAEFFREIANKELECNVSGFSSEARKTMVTVDEDYVFAAASVIRFKVGLIIFFLAAPSLVVCEADCPLKEFHTLIRCENVIPFIYKTAVSQSADESHEDRHPTNSPVQIYQVLLLSFP